MLAMPGLFVGGVLFGYYIVLPAAVHFLQTFNTSSFNQLVQATSYYSFAALMLLAMGVIFQVPLVVVAVARAGIVTPRQLRHNRRYAIVIAAAIAALLPGDLITMTLEAVPIIVLYEVGILVSAALERRDARRGTRRALAAPLPPPPHPHRSHPTMLFDLRSRGRRRVVKTVYVFLALLIGVGLVGFGVGTGSNFGGLFSVGGGGGGRDGRRDLQERAQEGAEAARRRTRTDPAALAALGVAAFNVATALPANFVQRRATPSRASRNFRSEGGMDALPGARPREAGLDPRRGCRQRLRVPPAGIEDWPTAETAQEIVAEALRPTSSTRASRTSPISQARPAAAISPARARSRSRRNPRSRRCARPWPRCGRRPRARPAQAGPPARRAPRGAPAPPARPADRR